MLRYFKYRIPFKNVFRTSGAEYSHREGFILAFKDEEGFEAYGEVAPLPGFSNETIKQVEEVLKVNKAHLEKSIKDNSGHQFVKVLEQIHQFPSLGFGLDTLLYDLEAKKARRSLINYLFPDFEGTLRSNAVVAIKTKEKVLSETEDLINKGFDTIKIKVGNNIEREFEILRIIRNHFPDINIRIDANQAWNVDEAIENLNRMNQLQIQYCEQPVPKEDVTALRVVTEGVDMAIAADESLRNISDVKRVSEKKAANTFILKPMMIGSFDNLFVTKEFANTHDIDVVYTTSLETAVGRATIAALAAGLGNQNLAHGLSTGSLLRKDIAPESWLNQPEILFPEIPGIGVQPDLEQLEEL